MGLCFVPGGAMHSDRQAAKAILSVHLDAAVDRALAGLARKGKTSKDDLIQKAVIRFLEDEEDYRAAVAAHKAGGRRYSLDQVKKDLGLAD